MIKAYKRLGQIKYGFRDLQVFLLQARLILSHFHFD